LLNLSPKDMILFLFNYKAKAVIHIF